MCLACELACRAAVCRRHLAGGPITANGYYYWLGVEAAGDNNFYGLDGSLFGKVGLCQKPTRKNTMSVAC
jgi:hypothetical protein